MHLAPASSALCFSAAWFKGAHGIAIPTYSMVLFFPSPIGLNLHVFGNDGNGFFS